MVVEHKGFRGRWNSSAAAVSASDLQDVDSVGPSTDPDCSWEHVELPDTENLFGNFDNTDTLDSSLEALDSHDVLPLQEPRFMHPKPKSVANKPESLSAESLAVKRTADELASRHVHKLTSDLKQPWQKDSELSQVFMDVFSPKATGTILKRPHNTFTICRSLEVCRCFDWVHSYIIDRHAQPKGAMTSKHKSSRGKEQQMELLPFTALGHVTVEDSWGDSWMKSRDAADVGSWNYFLNSWSESDHTWIDSRMSTAEATGWLRELLEPHVGSDRASSLTVHGLKATLLSWAAKSTLFTADEQLALGHHVNAQYRSAMIYSRDNQIGLCKKVHAMFTRIREGTFDPDATRVSRLFQLAFETALERDGGSSDSSSSDSEDASSVASSNGEHSSLGQKTTYMRLEADDIEADQCLINKSSKVIHLLAGEERPLSLLLVFDHANGMQCWRLRRLFFEAHALSLEDLKSRADRHDEALHSKIDTSLALDNAGGLRLSKKQRLDDVNVTGEHKLRQAFLRRSLAYDLAGIATFAVLDLWTQKLFEKMNEAPLSNYRHLSVEQVINADKALWVKVSNDTRGRLQPKTGADKPFDVSFEKFAEHPEVLQHLTPLQSVGAHKQDTSSTFTGGKGKGGNHSDGKGKSSKGKGKVNTGIAVPDDCEIFVDGKQLCKRWQDAVVQVVGTCPTKLAKERLSTVFHVKKLSIDLKLHEKELKASLHPDVSRCVNSKNILLFEKLLQQLNYWDMDVVDLLKFGVPLVGLQEPPTGYQRLLVPASMTEDELTASARWRRTSIMQTARQLSKSEEDALLEATASEVEKGFLQGPYSEAEMSVLMGTECWSLNPRFVLFQGASQKVRVIDDAKQSAVNSAYSSTVKL
ncbi:unnamed protein product [Cladocopium goreaui]|uniref:Uncharacterized protein n=1 Tax=Cladocopium goreaui TaxID=2562237 RepID=A0A9P1FPH4_9DINO|nr:unnamed protein product [Cladocopium goreaui]